MVAGAPSLFCAVMTCNGRTIQDIRRVGRLLVLLKKVVSRIYYKTVVSLKF